ncbi:hypothetical protein TREMEDRAFT_31927, partial [Tremella mesenterica DSM 1558]|uniref:uncharacterized protein n=1 Tax=Tremella mesenterica (strain ATCC 24925 / CBS 8224 / DSM 1558 / NBRC 9311 / NRRL Y-6157 / RJB 2259-6 / UBC 559-6) TaxID=578456 RepID=UPI0003F494ED
NHLNEMSRDPYVDVKREIESSLSSLQPLTNQFDRLSSQPSTSAYIEVRDQVRETLALLEADLEDLDESVRVVEATGERWGIGEEEVRRRRGFVEKVKREVDVLLQRQDDTLGVIAGTLNTLASQAGLIGHEVVDQNVMLDDLGTRVDHTDSRLRKVQRTMQDFIRRNEGQSCSLPSSPPLFPTILSPKTRSGWCICILIVVLIILLMAVILT